uniref:Uncharacterized protein n=1 Tax=Ananas comosus var. bracteatus TaxID=296719 RepID=A0A6V7NQD7_ANACO|nr:unnamed protein product [Ananas comosus var. bracteatus]
MRCASCGQIGRLHELVARQAGRRLHLYPRIRLPPATAAAPVTAIPPTASGSSVPIPDTLEAEQERSLVVLTAFRRFNPPTFQGDVKDPWLMEAWFITMEALFEDIYTLEKNSTPCGSLL